MSELTIDETIRKLGVLPQKIAEEGEKIMKEEVPIGLTGGLKNSVTSAIHGDSVEIYPTAPYAKYVQNGRGPVRPKSTSRRRDARGRFAKGKSRLRWFEYDGGQTSIHHGSGGVVFSLYAGPAEGNDFEGRTTNRLQAIIDAIWSST